MLPIDNKKTNQEIESSELLRNESIKERFETTEDI